MDFRETKTICRLGSLGSRQSRNAAELVRSAEMRVEPHTFHSEALTNFTLNYVLFIPREAYLSKTAVGLCRTALARSRVATRMKPYIEESSHISTFEGTRAPTYRSIDGPAARRARA